MSKYKNFLMDIEETIVNNITVNMVSESENVTELFDIACNKIKKLGNGQFIVGAYDDMIRDVCHWAWEEHWSQYREGC